MLKRICSIITAVVLISSMHVVTTSIASLAAETINEIEDESVTYIAEDFEAYSNYETAIEDLASDKWSYVEGSQSADADDTFRAACDENGNTYGMLNSPASTANAKNQTWKLNLSDNEGYDGLVTLSVKVKKIDLPKGVNYYIYTENGTILRLIALKEKISVYAGERNTTTDKIVTTSTVKATISTAVTSDVWSELEIVLNTITGKVVLKAGKGFSAESLTEISIDALKGERIMQLGIAAERFAENEGCAMIDDVKVICENFGPADEFSFDKISTENQGGVTSNLNLPSSFSSLNGDTYNVSWSSSDINVLSDNGEVMRSETDRIVSLTAEFSKDGTICGRRTFLINVLANGEYHFNEYFNGVKGTKISEYNSWGMTVATTSGQTAVIGEDPVDSENTVLKINRTGKSSSVQRVYRCFNDDGDKLSSITWVSASICRENSKQPFFMHVYDADDKSLTAAVQVEPNGAVKYRMYDADRSSNVVMNYISSDENTIPFDQWCNVSIKMDYGSQSFEVYVNGERAGNAVGYFYHKNNSSKTTVGAGYVEFDIERNVIPENAVINDTLYVDNVNVRVPADAFSVRNIYIQDKNGISSKNLESGGIINGATIGIQKTITEAPYIVAALYDENGVLIDVDAELMDLSKISAGIYKLDLDISIPVDSKALDYLFKIFVWGAEQQNPLMNAYIYEPLDEKIVIYVAGDSIGYDYPVTHYPQCGYGEVLYKFFDSDHVTVDDRAVGGRTTLSFIAEGRLDSVMGSIKNGDYLFIQFGHNDQSHQNEIGLGTKLDENATSASVEYAEGTYQYYLMEYVNRAREAGANPVLITPPPRNSTIDSNGYISNEALDKYVDAMREFAAAQNVLLVDLNRGWKERLKADGVTSTEEAKQYYMYIEENDPRFVNDEIFKKSNYYTIAQKENPTEAELEQWGLPHSDGTHLNVWSAEIAAEIIADGIKDLETELTIEKYINDYRAVCPWNE